MMKGLFGKKKEKPEKEKAEKPETEKAEKPERRGLFGKKKGAKGSKGAPAPAAPAAGAAGAAVDDAADEEALALAARLAALKPRARRSEFDVAYLREVMGRFERTKNLFSLVTNASISLGEAQALFQVDDSDDLRRLFERFAKPRGLGLGAIARPPPPLGELARVGRRKAGAADSRSSRESSRQPPALPPPPHEFELRADLFEVLSGLALVCDGELEARARGCSSTCSTSTARASSRRTSSSASSRRSRAPPRASTSRRRPTKPSSSGYAGRLSSTRSSPTSSRER